MVYCDDFTNFMRSTKHRKNRENANSIPEK